MYTSLSLSLYIYIYIYISLYIYIYLSLYPISVCSYMFAKPRSCMLYYVIMYCMNHSTL